MSSKPKDHTKTIATMKSMIGGLKKSVGKITKEKEKADAEKEQEVSPEEHKAALDHFASQYKLAKLNKDDAAASEHAKAYHAYAAKLNTHYHSKLKEDMDICNKCKTDPCICDESHGFVGEGKMGEKAAGDLDFNPEVNRSKERHGKSVPKKPAGEYDRKVISYLRKKYQKEEVEQVDEISDKTKQNYLNAARKDREELAPQKRAPDRDQANWARKKDDKRRAGINKVKSHLTPGTVGHTKVQARRMGEEVEQVDELNVMTLSKYASKARAQSMDKDNPKRYKRGSGAAKAYDKIHRGEYSESVNPYKLHEIKMSAEDEAKYNVDYGKRATKLLKHSWNQHDVSTDKKKAGDKSGAEKAAATSSRAHKLFIKARDKHLSKPANREAHIKKIMSGANDYYKSKKPGQYTGD